MSYLLGAPRIVSAIARDDSSAHPVLQWFSVRSNVFASMFKRRIEEKKFQMMKRKISRDEKRKKTDVESENGPRENPKRALFLTWVISQSLLLTGALDKLYETDDMYVVSVVIREYHSNTNRTQVRFWLSSS